MSSVEDKGSSAMVVASAETSREVLDVIVRASRDPAGEVGKLAGLLDETKRAWAVWHWEGLFWARRG